MVDVIWYYNKIENIVYILCIFIIKELYRKLLWLFLIWVFYDIVKIFNDMFVCFLIVSLLDNWFI